MVFLTNCLPVFRLTQVAVSERISSVLIPYMGSPTLAGTRTQWRTRSTDNMPLIGKEGACLSFATDAASRISSSNADRAMIHLGSNDFNTCVCEPIQLAEDILNIARRFISVDGSTKVQVAILSTTCYRYSCSSSRAPTAAAVKYPLRSRYNMLVDEVNAELRRLISFFPAIHFLEASWYASRLQVPSYNSDDGVHLCSPKGNVNTSALSADLAQSNIGCSS